MIPQGQIGCAAWNSRIFSVPELIVIALWTILSMMASATTPPPRRGCHSLVFDFSLNMYLKNTDLYQDRLNGFFDQSIDELKAYFTPHVEAAKKCGIRIHQMHMPYPNWIPTAKDHVNDYLLHEMAPKSMQLSEFLGCRNT